MNLLTIPIKFAGTKNLDPPLTIEYYEDFFMNTPDITITKSTDNSLFFIFKDHHIEYRQLINNSKKQSIAIIENGITEILSKNLETGTLSANGNEISVDKVTHLQKNSNLITTYDTWSNPSDYEYYEVSWGDVAFHNITVGILIGLFASVLPTYPSVVVSGIVGGLYAAKDNPDYRYISGTYVEKYIQIETTNYYYYRRVWNCYKDSDYTDLISNYTRIVY